MVGRLVFPGNQLQNGDLPSCAYWLGLLRTANVTKLGKPNWAQRNIKERCIVTQALASPMRSSVARVALQRWPQSGPLHFPIDQSLDVHYPWGEEATLGKTSGQGKCLGNTHMWAIKGHYFWGMILGSKSNRIWEAYYSIHYTYYTCIKELGSHYCVHIKHLLLHKSFISK